MTDGRTDGQTDGRTDAWGKTICLPTLSGGDINIDFSHSQGQITLQSRIVSGRNSNSSEMLWPSLLLPNMKKI